MSALAFLVRHRTIDLVAMTAAQALRSHLGLNGSLIHLRRDDAYVVEHEDLGDSRAWVRPCAERVHWFNPNKHRHALFEAEPGAVQAVQEGRSFPRPWLGPLVDTDRPDLQSRTGRGLARWLAFPACEGAYAAVLASWQRDDAVATLPPGPWPRPESRLVRLQLWSLALRADDPEAASRLAEEAAVTRRRTSGLLIHPHVEGWSLLEPPWPLDEESIE